MIQAKTNIGELSQNFKDASMKILIGAIAEEFRHIESKMMVSNVSGVFTAGSKEITVEGGVVTAIKEV